MSTVGSINIALSANTQEFTTKLEKASGKVKSLGKEGEGGFGSDMFTKMTLGITSVATGIEAITELGKGAFEIVEKIGESAVEAAKHIGEWVAEATAAAATSYKMSQALGMSSQSFMSLGSAAKEVAGTSAEEFSQMIVKMQKALGTATIAKQLDDIGLNTKKLSGLAADQKFLAIADAIRGMTDPMQQVVAATTLFGREGAKMLPLLLKGSDAIREMQAEAVSFGTAMSDIDASKVTMMSDESRKLQEHWEGIKDTLAISVAPVVFAIEQGIESMIPPANQLKLIFETWVDDIAHFADSIVTSARILLDLTQGVKGLAAAAYDLNHPFTGFVDAAVKANNAMDAMMRNKGLHASVGGFDAETVTQIQSMAAAVKQMQFEAATSSLDAFNKKLAEFAEKNRGVRGFAAAFADYAIALNTVTDAAKNKKLADFIDSKRIEAAKAGLSGVALMLEEIAELHTKITNAQRDQLVNYQKIIDAAAEQKKWTEQIESMHKEAETPLQRYVDRLKEINQALQHGLSLEDAKALRLKAQQQLLSGMKQSNDPGIVDARMTRFNLSPPVPERRDPQQDIIAAIKAQAQINAKELVEAQRTNQLLQDNGYDVVGFDN